MGNSVDSLPKSFVSQIGADQKSVGRVDPVTFSLQQSNKHLL